jgi:FkbM family methyltransferase
VITEAAGLHWDVDPDSGDSVGPSHEDHLTEGVLGLIPPGGTFLDVGAHVGHYAIRAARVAAWVIAIEANPDTAERLRRNRELNRIKNLTVFTIAAWDSEGYLGMENPLPRVRSGMERVHRGKQDPSWLTVQCRPLDAILGSLTALDVVKIDTEGAEPQVLAGLAGTIARLRPAFLFIEDHSLIDYYPRIVLNDAIRKLNYDWEEAGQHGQARYLLCQPRKG